MNVLDFLTNGQASQLGTNGDGAQRLVANLMLQRSELMKSLLDSPRDVDSDCGYPSGYISTELYKLLYDREPLATRTVEVYPKESWQVFPSVFEDEDVNNITPFEEAWDALGKQLRGEQSFYQEEEASTVWTYLSDADIKCGIGHYAGILLGLDDGAPLNEPAEMISSANGNGTRKASGDSASRRLLFIRVFGETDMRINSLETDMSSPRYGQPTEYDISLIDPTEFTSLGLGASLPTNRAVVHWSRVVHISEYGVLHTPRMQPVLNRLLDTRKLYGGSAEMYWRGAFPGYAIKTQPQLGADVDINKEDVKQQLTDYSNALQRFLVLMGMDITALAPQVSDPASQIDKQIEAICIQLGVPKRIFMGSERGELASTQDDQAFDDRLKQRQLGVITPRIIIPVVDRLISLRVLPRPTKGYRVSWPDLTSKSDEEKAGIATQRTQAIAAYTAGQLETTLAPMDFWTRIMGFTEDEAQSIIANAEELKAQKEKEQAAKDAEAARVQAEAQAKIDEAAKMAADATGSEQTATAPGSPTSPGKAPGQGDGVSPTQPPQSGASVKPGGSNAAGVGSTPVVHSDPTLVADFDPSQARDSQGKWTKGAVEAARTKSHDYIRENGPTSHDELAYHLVDEGIVDKHGDGLSLVHRLVDAGHLVAGSDEHGRDTLHIPSQHDAASKASESWKPAADTQAIIQRAHVASTAADRVSSTATDATSHRRAAEAHASAVMVVGDTAERLRSEKAPESEVTRYGDLKSYHAQMEARHRSQSVGWPAKGLAPVNPEAARAAGVPTSPKEHPVSKGTSTAAIPTHTAADLDRMSMQQMRQLAIKLGVRGARSKGARSLREELLVRAIPESSGGLLGHSLSADDISVLINSGELDVNAICRDWHGRFARCGSEGITPSERDVISTDRMAHARHLVEQVRGGQASNPATVKALADHLGTLTVAQLHSLKKEYGLSASGKNKAALKEKLTARFSQKVGIAPAPAATSTPKATETTQTPSLPPAPPTPVHVPAGTFGTTKDIIWKHADHEAHAHELARQILGPNATAHDLVSVAGIPDGARVEVATLDGGIAGKHAYVEGTGTVQIKNPDTGEMEHNKYTAARTISIHPDGTRDIHNDSFEGKGSGLQMFGRQVENATRWGFTHIRTYAAGQGSGETGKRPEEGDYNGYYTWPRFGYNGKVDQGDISLMPPNVRYNTEAAGGMVSGVMSTKEGRDYWMGHGHSMSMKFDLTPGSYSQDTLNTYLKHRGLLK